MITISYLGSRATVECCILLKKITSTLNTLVTLKAHEGYTWNTLLHGSVLNKLCTNLQSWRDAIKWCAYSKDRFKTLPLL